MLTEQEYQTFRQFKFWAISNTWLIIFGLDNLERAISLEGDLTASNVLITKLLENIKLRDDTKDVLIKMQYAIDRELDKRGATL
jgi:hypothetical protein